MKILLKQENPILFKHTYLNIKHTKDIRNLTETKNYLKR